MFDGSGQSMAPGTAGALGGSSPQGNPSNPNVQQPGGDDNQKWKVLMQQYNMVDAALRALRNVTIHSIPDASRAAMGLDEMCAKLGKIREELQQAYVERQQAELAQQAAGQLTGQGM